LRISLLLTKFTKPVSNEILHVHCAIQRCDALLQMTGVNVYRNKNDNYSVIG